DAVGVLPGALAMVDRVRGASFLRGPRVEEPALEDRHVEVGDEALEEEWTGALLVDDAEGRSRPQLADGACEQGMPRHRADQGVVDMPRLAVAEEQLDPVEQRLEGAETLEVAVDVDAAVAMQELEAEQVGALRRDAQQLVDLPAHEIGRQVL